jgi:hypothetical protein
MKWQRMTWIMESWEVYCAWRNEINDPEIKKYLSMMPLLEYPSQMRKDWAYKDNIYMDSIYHTSYPIADMTTDLTELEYPEGGYGSLTSGEIYGDGTKFFGTFGM